MIEEKKYITVSQLNEYLKMKLDSDALLSGIAVRGEISNFKRHYSGHLYFSLKDSAGSVRCVMFAGSAAGLNFLPADGNDVIAFGRVSVYPRDGVYQIYVSSLVAAGLGDLYAAFERLKKKLSDEGLFDESRKRKLPRFPRAIGLVTSSTGAAVRDMITVLGRRFPPARVILYPALVQGAGAPASVIGGIDYFNAEKNVDLIIVGRGGGSFEDLSCFNDENLARRIAASDIPVISAVGHETDFTIADFVADLRAPTPSAAAELAVPDISELLSLLLSLSGRMRSCANVTLNLYSGKVASLAGSAALSTPARLIDLYEERLSSAAGRADAALAVRLAKSEKAFSEAAVRLESLSPLGVLSRGYAMINRDGIPVTGARGISAGDKVSLVFSDGSAEASVTRVFVDD